MSNSNNGRNPGHSGVSWPGPQFSKPSRSDFKPLSTDQKIAASWGQTPRAVEYWEKRIGNEKLKEIEPRIGPGRPPALSDQQLEFLCADLKKGPQSVGYKAARWSGPLLQRYIAEYYGAKLTVRHCQRLIKQSEGETYVVSYMRN